MVFLLGGRLTLLHLGVFPSVGPLPPGFEEVLLADLAQVVLPLVHLILVVVGDDPLVEVPVALLVDEDEAEGPARQADGSDLEDQGQAERVDDGVVGRQAVDGGSRLDDSALDPLVLI